MAATEKLQLLADALALEFSQSQATASCTAALRRLLPGLEYLGISLTNPVQADSIVASANCAVEGPTTLHVHDLQCTAAGMALSRSQPLLLTSFQADAATSSGKAVPSWTDVQQMMEACPSVSHLLCVPFGTGRDGDPSTVAAAAGTSSGGDGPAQCQQHNPNGSGTGALLLGFLAPPVLDARRAALLALLATCLPASMARLSGQTLAWVNFACGSSMQCMCGCQQGESDGEGEEDEEESSAPSSPCREQDRRTGGGGAAPSQALRVPAAAAAAVRGQRERQAGGVPAGDDEHAAGPSHRKAAAAEAEDGGPPCWRQLLHGPVQHSLSKTLLTFVEEDPNALQRRPLALTFRSALVEAEYCTWVTRYHHRADSMFSLLLLLALVILAFPYRIIERSAGTLLFGLGLALPFVCIRFNRTVYSSWREVLVAAFRLYVVSFASMVYLRTFQIRLPMERAQHWFTFWRLTSAESLCITALSFQSRLQMHIAVQVVALAIAAASLPQMCAECYPSVDASTCFRSSFSMAAIFGLLLPTAGLWYLERRSRTTFATLLREATASRS